MQVLTEVREEEDQQSSSNGGGRDSERGRGHARKKRTANKAAVDLE